MDYHAQQFGGNPQALLRQIARAYAALEAASAWDPAPTEMICNGMESVLLYFWYLRGGAGGDMQFRVESTPFILDAQATAATRIWGRATLFSSGLVVSGADSLSNIQRTDVEYGSGGAPVEGFVYGPLELGQAVERLRVICRETGAVGTPGSVEIVALFSPV